MSRQSRSMPSKAQIAAYWAEQERLSGQVAPWGFWDWGEPSCWACGYFLGSVASSPSRRDRSIFSVWNRSSLERCHITPRYLDDQLRDTPDRLVLMCGRCHAEHPDFTTDAESFAWMRSRQGLWWQSFVVGGVK